MAIVKKAFQSLKKNGVLLTLLKIWDYISFKIRSKKKDFNPISVNTGKIAIVTNPRGIDIKFKEMCLTNNAGFNSRLQNLEKWHDSTQSEFSFQKLDSNQILVKQYWWNLPLTQYWEISLKSNTILWQVFLEMENSIAIEKFKAGIILDYNYINSRILTKNTEITLPGIDNVWKTVSLPLNAKEVLFKVENNSSHIAQLKFSVIDSIDSSQIIIQNATRFSNGRFVQAVLLNDRIYNAGCHELFKIMLELTV